MTHTGVGLKREFAIGGAEVLLELDEQVYSQGDRITGSVSVIPPDGQEGELPHPIVELNEYWTRTEDDDEASSLTTRTQVSSRDKVLLEEFSKKTVVRRKSFSVQLETARCYRFALRLPKNCRPSTETTGWNVVVHLEAKPPAHPTSGRLRLGVDLGEELQAVLEAFTTRLRFREDPAQRRWDAASVTARFRLLPPKPLEAELDHIDLELLQSAAGVKGTISFDLQEKSILDYFKSLFEMDIVKQDFALERGELVTPEGTTNLDSVTRALSERLQEVLGKR